MSVREFIRQKLVAYEENRYKAKLSERKITYDQWIFRETKDGGSVVCKMSGQRFAGERISDDEPEEEPQIVLIQIGEGTLAAGAEEEIKAFFERYPYYHCLLLPWSSYISNV